MNLIQQKRRGSYELKQKYKELKNRYDKAEEYFSSDASQEEKEKYLPNYQKLLSEIRLVHQELLLQENQETFLRSD